MADEKNVVKGKEKEASGNKFVNFFKNFWPNVSRPFKNMWHELRKVTWPTRKEWINCTLIVLAFMAFMGVTIGLLDLGSSALIQWITGLALEAVGQGKWWDYSALPLNFNGFIAAPVSCAFGGF